MVNGFDSDMLIKQGIESQNLRDKTQADADNEAKLAKLRDYLTSQATAKQQGTVDASGQYKPGTEAAAKQYEQNQEANKAQNLFDQNRGSGGGTVKVGGVSVGEKEFNPYQQQAQAGKNEEGAYQKAYSTYNKGIGKLPSAIGKIAEGMSAVNDPNQVGSAGAAKSMLISGVAQMNRYNQDEGRDLVPSTWLQKATQYANQLGDDKNPLTPTQKASINSLLAEGLQGLQQQHEAIKQNALGQYTGSRYSDPNRAKMLQDSLGKPIDNQISSTMEKNKPIPVNPSIQSGGTPTPQPSMLDKLKSYFGGGQAGPQQPVPPPTVQQQTQSQTSVPSHPMDSTAIEWAKKNLQDPANAKNAQAILKANGVQ